MKMARSSTDSQHYSLKWNDYSTKMVAAFQSLRADQDFVDVTIACDSHHYEAHKMVLSACSPYFRSILKVNPCKHPIIILKDVSHSEMEKLLEFMYNGEVNIAQEYLPAFLKVAENLKIKGLAGSASEMEQLYNSTKNSSDSPNDKSFNNSAISNYSDNRIKDDIPNKPTVKKRKIDYHDMDDTTTTDRQIHNSILGASKALVVLKNEPFDEYMAEVVEKSSETDARAETVYSDMTQDSLAPREDGSSVLEDSSPHDNADGCEALNLSVRPQLNHCSQPASPLNQLQPPVNHVRYKHHSDVYSDNLNGPSNGMVAHYGDYNHHLVRYDDSLYNRRASSVYPPILSPMDPPVQGVSQPTSPSEVVYKVKLEEKYMLHCVDKMDEKGDSTVLNNTINTILSAEMSAEQKTVKREVNGSCSSSDVPAIEGYSPVKRNSRSPVASNGGKLYPCSKCHKVFRHPMSLHHHRHVHIGTYTCQCCNKVFSRRWDLHRHLHRSKLGCRRPKELTGAGERGPYNLNTNNSEAYMATIKAEPYFGQEREYLKGNSPQESPTSSNSSPVSTGPSN